MKITQQTVVGGIVVLALAAFMVAQNTRTVHAAGGPVVVQVTGTASTADINNPDLQPVQFNLFPRSSTSSTATATFTVPAGKRLIIDYTSGQAQDLSGGAALFEISTVVNGSGVGYIVYVNKDDNNAVNQTVHICADPGTTVQAFSANASPATSTAGSITCSGHYVNVP